MPFSNSFRPGKKTFDFDINQISYNPDRAKAVDFAKSYYFVNQAVVGRKGTPITKAKIDRRPQAVQARAQVGTTSYTYIVDSIKPSRAPLVYDTNDAAVQALKNGQIDGIVVDLPTAFYVTAVQVPNGDIVGKLPTSGRRSASGWSSRRATRSRRA